MVKVTDIEILCWSFWLKFLEWDISWTLEWIQLILYLMLDIDLYFTLFHPYPISLTDLEDKVTDLEFFMINEMSLSHQSVIRKHSSFKYKNFGGTVFIPKLLTPGYMGWDCRSKYRRSSYSSEFEGFLFFFFFLFCFKYILVLLAWRSSGEPRCSATALIVSVRKRVRVHRKRRERW